MHMLGLPIMGRQNYFLLVVQQDMKGHVAFPNHVELIQWNIHTYFNIKCYLKLGDCLKRHSKNYLYINKMEPLLIPPKVLNTSWIKRE